MHLGVAAARGAVYGLGDEVALNSGGPVMTVAGVSAGDIGLRYLCTWTDKDGQAFHDWFKHATVTLLRRAEREAPSSVVPLRHVRCGKEVSIAVLKGDVAYYVWCETCCDLVEEGELFPPIDETAVRLQVHRERVRPVDGHSLPTTDTVEVEP